MALTATFAYNNLDATSDLNLHFKALFAKGFVSGGTISVVPSTSNVTVGPFYAASADGMIVRNDTEVVVACVAGQLNYVVLRAVYNAPAAPTLSLECLSQANYASDPQSANLLAVGTVNLVGVSQASTSAISYSVRDTVDVTGHNPFLGSYASVSARDAAWPSAAPVKQKPNDFLLVTADAGAKPAFHMWSGTAWVVFGNYEAVSTAFATHTAGLGTTGGTNVHVSQNEKAALAGSHGTPGPLNVFVTTSDTNLLLTPDEKAAINGTITGPNPLSATNPLVADGLPVAVTKIFGVQITATTDHITVQRASTGNGIPAFDDPAYVGFGGLDTAHGGVSSAAYWFKLMDSSWNGYTDDKGPLYIINVQDQTGSGTYNPSTDTTNVDSSTGYWDPETPATGIRLVFNRQVDAGKTVFVGFNAMGSISRLAPGGATHRPPSTGFHAGIEAYQRVDTQVVNTQTVNSAVITMLAVSSGTGTAPSISFPVSTTPAIANKMPSGLYAYDADLGNAMHNSPLYDTVGLVSGGDPLFVAGKLDPSNPTTPANPLTITRVNRGLLHLGMSYDSATVSQPMLFVGFTDRNGPKGRVDQMRFFANAGAGNDPDGFIMVEVPLALSKPLFAFNGTEAKPGIQFGNGTGFYSKATVTADQLTTYNAVALSMSSRTAFVFSTNTPSQPSLLENMYRPLMFEQNFDVNADTIDYRIAITETTDSAVDVGAIRFGEASYNSDFTEWASVNKSGVAVHGTLAAFSSTTLYADKLLTTPRASFVASASGFSLNWVATNVNALRYDAPTTTTTITGNLAVTSVVRVGNGTEAAPTFSFTAAPTTGLFYAGLISTDGLTTQSGVGVSVGGATVVVFSRHEAAPAGLETIAAPLVVEQHIDGSDVETRLIAFDREESDPNTALLSIGGANYTDDYTAWMTFTGTGITASKKITASAGIATTFVNASGNVAAQAITAATSLTTPVVNVSTGVRVTGTTSASTVGLSVASGTQTGIYGQNHLVGIAVDGTTVGRFTPAGLVVAGTSPATALTVQTNSLTLLDASTSQPCTLVYDDTKKYLTAVAPFMCVSGDGSSRTVATVHWFAESPGGNSVAVTDRAIRYINLIDKTGASGGGSRAVSIEFDPGVLQEPVVVVATVPSYDPNNNFGMTYIVTVKIGGVALPGQPFTLCSSIIAGQMGTNVAYILPGTGSDLAYVSCGATVRAH